MTVAFVSYKFFDNVRRVGPMPTEAAEPYAREVARREKVTEVRLEKWACVQVVEIPK